MFKPYIDLHTHSTLSDGTMTPQQLAEQARAAGVRILAITDHNYTGDLTAIRTVNPDITFIQGVEISCLYTQADGKEVEIHVVGLGFDPQNSKIRSILSHNQPDRRPYINSILEKLRSQGIDLGTYEDLRRANPNTKHLGRMQIAQAMKVQGFVHSVDEAFDRYIGAFGERLAFVPNPLRYVSIEEAVEAIRSAGGIAALAHLFYYQLGPEENIRLVQYFKKLAGDDGALEVYYSRYTSAQRLMLLKLANQFGLMYSAASDFHGSAESERIDNRFSHACCADLLARFGIEIDAPLSQKPIVVLGGFSGSGKGTLIKEIPADFCVHGKKPVVITSVTTRKPRDASENYIFVSKDAFGKMVEEDAFLEYNEAYSDNSYGTPKETVFEALQNNRLPILEIDQTGLIRLLTEGRVNPKQILRIFIVAAPGKLLERLWNRKSEDKGSLRKRLDIASKEATMVHRLYQSVIDNDRLCVARQNLMAALSGETVNDDFSESAFRSEMEEILHELNL